MVTFQEMSEMIGRVGELEFTEGLSVSVRVTDVKSAYGQVRIRIEPVAGVGSAWIAARRLVVPQETGGA